MRPWLIGMPFLVILLPTTVQADGPTPEETLAKAEAAFRNGVENKSRLLLARKNFSEATDEYLRLHEHGNRSAALYRSLGNAAVLADRWPEAIWAYQCGLKIDPNDGAMREHLAFVRGKVLYSPSGLGRPNADTWPTWLHQPTNFELSLTWILFHIMMSFAGAIAFVKRTRAAFDATGLLALVALAASIGDSQVRARAAEDRIHPLVIMATNADFHRGNGPSYPKHPVLPVLPRGLEARQTHRRGDWLQIRLTTDETGWVHASQTLIVGP